MVELEELDGGAGGAGVGPVASSGVSVSPVRMRMRYDAQASVSDVLAMPSLAAKDLRAWPPSMVVARGCKRRFLVYAPDPSAGREDGYSAVVDHPGYVAAFTVAEGLLIAAGGRATFFWDTQTWELRQTLPLVESAGEIRCVVFDGRFCAVGCSDGKVEIYQAQKGGFRFVGATKKDGDGDRGGVHAVYLVGGKDLVACYGGPAGAVAVWQLANGKLSNAWVNDSAGLCVDVSIADGLLCCLHKSRQGSGAYVQLLDISTGQGGQVPPALAEGHEGPTTLLFDGVMIAVGFASGAIVAWNTKQRYSGWVGHHAGEVGGLSSFGGALVSVGADCTVRLWEFATGRPLGCHEFRKDAGQPTCLHAYGDFVVCGFSNGSVETLPMEDIKVHAGDLRCGAVHQKYIRKFDDGTVRGSALDHPDAFNALVRGPDLPGGGKNSAKTKHSKADKAESRAPSDRAARTRLDISLDDSDDSDDDDDEGGFEVVGRSHAGKSEASQVTGAGSSPSPAAAPASQPSSSTSAAVQASKTFTAFGAECSNPGCQKREQLGKKFQRCGQCKLARYCSQPCQVAHWKGKHRRECKIP